MTNYTRYELAAYKLWVLNRTAQMLGINDEFLDASELMQRIEGRDSRAAQKLDRFFKAYDDWYDHSSLMIEDETIRAKTAVQDELGNKIHERDEERQALLTISDSQPQVTFLPVYVAPRVAGFSDSRCTLKISGTMFKRSITIIP
jgi:hypothetical protein